MSPLGKIINMDIILLCLQMFKEDYEPIKHSTILGITLKNDKMCTYPRLSLIWKYF
jgi:hypothetical protein